MIFSRVRLRAGREAVRLVERGKLANTYDYHRLIWSLFSRGPNHRRDFLYRHNEQSARPEFYTVSVSTPSGENDLWSIESKEYGPRLKDGMRLTFTVTVNPVVTHTDESGKQKRHDVVMHARRNKEEFQKIGNNRGYVAQLEGVQWLTKRKEKYGFEPEEGSIVADGYRQVRFRKGNTDRNICISMLDIKGVLTVSDVDLFTRALYDGIGPAKGFGCGLMLVKPY